MQHVVQIIDNLQIGGAQKLLVTLLHNKSYDNLKLTILSLGNDNQLMGELISMGANVHCFPGSRLFDRKRISKIYQFLRSERTDVVHSHLTYSNIVGGLVAKLLHIPHVATLHNVKNEPRYDGTIRQRIETAVLRYCTNTIIAVGDSVADSHRQRWRRKDICVVQNAVNVTDRISSEQRETVRHEVMGKDPELLLINVARLTPAKDHLNLLRAFAIVIKRIPTAYLIIVGDGPLRHELESFIEANKLTPYARLLGERNDIPVLLRSSDLYVSSSKAEGMPLSVLEAMGSELAVVATAAGDIATVVGESGVVVEPQNPQVLANKICTLLEMPKTREELASSGFQLIKDHYSSKMWVKQLFEIYKTNS